MAVLVKIGKAIEEKPKESDPIELKLNVRKTLDGNILIFDHADIDIAKGIFLFRFRIVRAEQFLGIQIQSA